MSNTIIEAEARRRGMTVDELFRETSQRVLQHMTPERRASVLAREARRAGTSPAGRTVLREPRVAAPKATPIASPAVTETEMAAAFQRAGLSAESARVAARGRAPHPTGAGSLIEAGQRLGLMPAAAHAFARGRHGLGEAIKNVAGLPAECFAWVPDPEDPTTWQMQISRNAGVGSEWSPDEDLVRAAVAQLPGVATFGKALDIPATDLPAVKATLRAAWIACGADIDEIPPELTMEALRAAFRSLGLSERGAQIAAKGR